MQEIFIYTRTIELLVSMVIGAFLCWLGYRLFFKGLSDKSDLKMEYGKIKFQIFSASPGIFFSLFGAIIIFSSVWRVATFQEEHISSNGLKTRTFIAKGSSSDSNEKIQDFNDIHDAFTEAHELHIAGKQELAEALYMKILRAVPDMDRVTNNLADLKNAQKKTEQALVYAKFSVTVYPEFVDARKTLEEIIH